MKRIKAMLAGIAVLAVVGGVFAFKAKSAFGTNLYYTTVSTTFKVTTSTDLIEVVNASTTTKQSAAFPYSTSVYYSTALTTSLVPTKSYMYTFD